MTTDERPPAERLLAAAEELFGQRSYGRPTVADVCAGGGGGPRQLLGLLRVQGGSVRRRRPGDQRGPEDGDEGGPGAGRRRPAHAGTRVLPRVLRDDVEASVDGQDRARVRIRRARPVP